MWQDVIKTCYFLWLSQHFWYTQYQTFSFLRIAVQMVQLFAGKYPLNEEVEIEVLYVAPFWHKTQVLKGGGKNVKRGGRRYEKSFLTSYQVFP